MVLAILLGLALVVGYIRRRRRNNANVLAQLKRHRTTPAIENPAYLSSDEHVRPISIAQGLALRNPNYSSVGHKSAFQDVSAYAVLDAAYCTLGRSDSNGTTGAYDKAISQSQVFLVPTEGGEEAAFTQACVAAPETRPPASETTGSPPASETTGTTLNTTLLPPPQGYYTVERPQSQSLYSIPLEGGGEAIYSEANGMAALPPPPLIYDIPCEDGSTVMYAEVGEIGEYLDVEGSVLEQPMYDAATASAPLAEVPQYDIAAPQLHTPSLARHGTLEVAKGDPFFAETTM